eukprot:777638-Pyramimonas_sp.AAC.1
MVAFRKRRRSRFTASVVRSRAWELREWERGQTEGSQHGALALEEHLLSQYASGALDAKAFCLTCHFATQA